MTYIVVSENEIVKAEMERPNENNYYRIDGAGIKFLDKDAYYRDRDLFTCHIASLPRIPAPGHKWEMWQSVVEGKDFELKQRKQPSPFCRDCADAEVLGICDYDGFPCNGSAIAIPIQPTQNKIVKEDMICPETGKYCDDECCTVGSICNVSGSTDGIPPQPTPEGKKVEDYYPGYQYQRLFNAIHSTGGTALQGEMDEIIRIVHKDFPLTNDNTQTK